MDCTGVEQPIDERRRRNIETRLETVEDVGPGGRDAEQPQGRAGEHDATESLP